MFYLSTCPEETQYPKLTGIKFFNLCTVILNDPKTKFKDEK